MITKPIKEGVNSLIKNLVEKQLAKKKLNVTYIIIFKDSFKKMITRPWSCNYEKSFNAFVVC